MNQDNFVISMLVRNEAGVLTRVSGLFARRAFNIDTLSVGETEDPKISRITITAKGDDYIKEQIIRQLDKLHDVLKTELLSKESIVMREMLLIKLNISQEAHKDIMQAVDIFRAKVVDLSSDSVTVEITGNSSKCAAFLDYLRRFGISEICRTGVTAISRGSKTLTLGASVIDDE